MKLKDRSWLAGFVDGEGMIALHKRPEKRFDKIYYQILPRIVIANTNKKLMYKLFLMLKPLGTFHIQKRTDKPKWKDCYLLKFSNQKAIKFLKIIYPYLKLKKIQAKLCFEFYKTVSRQRNWEGLTSVINKKREELYQKIKQLNKRGK